MHSPRARAKRILSNLKKECMVRDCIFPGCSEKGIKAHSIQRANILSHIAEEGHVLSFEPIDSIIKPPFDLIDYGIGIASTFFGFCQKHDSELFKDIEIKEYHNEPHQNLLFALRACAYEYTAKRFQAGLVLSTASETPHPEIIKSLGLVHRSIKDLVHFLNTLFNETKNTKPTSLTTHYYTIPYESPIATNSCLIIPYDFSGRTINDFTDFIKILYPIFLNIFPQGGRTHIICSYFIEAKEKYEPIFIKVDSFSTVELENFFSQIVLMHCENFFVTPSRWRKLAQSERSNFVVTFIETGYYNPPENYLQQRAAINIFQRLKA